MTTTSTLLLGSVRVVGPMLALVAGDRYRMIDEREPAVTSVDLVLTPPCSEDVLLDLRRTHPGATVVVVDRRDGPPPADVSTALAVADAYVCGRSVVVLAAHLDALTRRRHQVAA